MVISEIERYRASKKVTITSMFVNTLLAALKMVIGLIGRSPALFADGIHSFSDLLSDIMVLFATKHANKGADYNHPYGHERIETLATVVLSIMLIMIALLISYHSIQNWFIGELIIPDQWTIYAAIFSIVANEGLFRYIMVTANRIGSDLLRANAWHSRSDMWSSVVVLIGLIGTTLGVTWMDSLAAIIVSIMIGKMGVEWCYKALSELVDTGVNEEILHKIEETIAKVDGVKRFHCLRTRKMAGQIILDVHVLVDSHITASEGHYVAEHVRGALALKIENIKDITVHVDVAEHPEQIVDPKDMPPNRTEIMRQLEVYLVQNHQNVNLHQIELFVYYYSKKIELYLLAPAACKRALVDANLESFKIEGMTTIIKLFMLHSVQEEK
ncbi:cation diffusion facilitator family transporter [Fastidiosibacter lacustris]|uniref:cation diffusion facilitator family transporter n=1 Tax=Fastidiosibacter lacustris TaxID=2056695 RepID=UPI001EFD3438|nr:cation diffusion facilitator family transporter [Fastidiosibacter lacustris]